MVALAEVVFLAQIKLHTRAPACNIVWETFEGENFRGSAFRDGNFRRMLN